jgi:hypothetical protein
MLLLDDEPLPWTRWGEEFAAAMPNEIRRLQEHARHRRHPTPGSDSQPRRLDLPALSPQRLPTHAIRQAHCDHQEVAESRRHLATDVGETTRAFLDELVAAGWS